MTASPSVIWVGCSVGVALAVALDAHFEDRRMVNKSIDCDKRHCRKVDPVRHDIIEPIIEGKVIICPIVPFAGYSHEHDHH